MTRRLTADERADVKIARHLREWLDRRDTTLVASVSAAMSGDVWEIWPASRRFGRPAVTAAAITTLPAGACCRWGMASVFAHDSGQPSLKFSLALQALIGDPCPRCLTAMTELTDLQVHAGLSDAMRRRVAARTARRAVVASIRAAAPALHDPFTQPCAICHDYRARARVALTAGAEIETLRPHKPRPASTGYAGIVTAASRSSSSSTRAPIKYMHELVGGEQRCNCPMCKTSRSRAARKLMARGRAE
jgi:hypothetical protein